MFKITVILCTAISLCGNVSSQSYEECIYRRKWYAIKILTGGPGELKETQIAAEEDCVSLPFNKPYFFDISFPRKGFVKTDYKFKPYSFGVPLQCWITDDQLTIRYSDAEKDNVVLQILLATDDFLQLSGPGKKMYFFISDRKLQ